MMKTQRPLLLFQAATVLLALHDTTAGRSDEPATKRLTQSIIVDKEENHDGAVVSSRRPSWTPKPKMNAKPIVPGESSLFTQEMIEQIDDIAESKAAFFIGTCSSSSPFEFPIGGKSGRGAIGFDSSSSSPEELSLSSVTGNERIVIKSSCQKTRSNKTSLPPLERERRIRHHSLVFRLRMKEGHPKLYQLSDSHAVTTRNLLM